MNIYLKLLLIFLGFSILVILFIGLEVFLSRKGTNTDVPVISREPSILGSGEKVNFLVLGDSTSAGQGGNYSNGIAVSSATFISKNNRVIFYNFSVSGAKINDVLTKQWPDAKYFAPDVVLVSVGANDATGLTSLNKLSSDFDNLAKELIASNCNVKIIFTGSPDMGTVPRIVEPLRTFAGWRSRSVNKAIDEVVDRYQLIRAPILEKTGPVFAKDSSLFAIDKYHPNERGYRVWTPVLEASISEAVRYQPSHCKS